MFHFRKRAESGEVHQADPTLFRGNKRPHRLLSAESGSAQMGLICKRTCEIVNYSQGRNLHVTNNNCAKGEIRPFRPPTLRGDQQMPVDLSVSCKFGPRDATSISNCRQVPAKLATNTSKTGNKYQQNWQQIPGTGNKYQELATICCQL